MSTFSRVYAAQTHLLNGQIITVETDVAKNTPNAFSVVGLPDKAVEEMARVTKKYLVLLEPNRNNPVQFAFGLLHPREHGTLSFTKKRLLDYVKQINFKLISCNATGWLFAGASPTFSLKLCKHLPFVHRLGTVNIMICKKE